MPSELVSLIVVGVDMVASVLVDVGVELMWFCSCKISWMGVDASENLTILGRK